MLLVHLKVEGHSMEPTILNGQSVFASSIPYLFVKPRIGDIAVVKQIYKYTSMLVIKRIREIKGNKFYVLGDNKLDSSDSRKYGWIDRDQIVAKVIYKI